jgi:hypothetical protein
MAMASNASGGTGVGPGASKYRFIIKILPNLCRAEFLGLLQKKRGKIPIPNPEVSSFVSFEN